MIVAAPDIHLMGGLAAVGENRVRVKKETKNVSIALALQLEAVGRRAGPIRFNFVARAEFELAQPIRCRLRAFFPAYTLHYAVTLNFDTVTLTFDL